VQLYIKNAFVHVMLAIWAHLREDWSLVWKSLNSSRTDNLAMMQYLPKFITARRN